MKLLLLPLIPSVVLGLLNYAYWYQQGYKSINVLILGCFVFYAGSYLFFKHIVFSQ